MAGIVRKSGALRVFFLGLVILGCASCSRISGKLRIIEGNFFYTRGMYTAAIRSYLEALRYPETVPYGEYGLGSVYLSLNEGTAAARRFADAEKALRALPRENHRELAYRIYYNSGIIRFEEKDYKGAVEQFRNALEIDSGRVEAKRNLELSLLSLNSAVSAAVPEDVPVWGEMEALFEYIREKEQTQWKSREWTENAAAGPDY
jgi:Ca-activated chloride channel family protein